MASLPPDSPPRSVDDSSPARAERHPIRSFVVETATGIGVLALVLGIAGAPEAVSGNRLADVSSARPRSLAEAVNAPEPALFGSDALGRFLVGAFGRSDTWPVWTTDSGALQRAGDLMSALQAAPNEGLDPRIYGLPVIEAALATRTPESLRKAEALLTRAALMFSLDRLLGQSRRNLPWDQKVALLKSEEHLRVEDLLAGLATADDLRSWLTSLAPVSTQYNALADALARYRSVSDPASGLALIPDGPALRAGDRDPRIPLVRARLLAQPATATHPGLAATEGSDTALYDEALADAVRTFQSAEGLGTDGILGPQTVASLNRGLGQKIARVETALERWRLLPRQLGPVHILVNIPQFELFLEDGNTTALRMKVAVGSPGRHATPLFSDTLRYMEFNPYWNVPPSIARAETVPKQRNDPDYMAKRGYTVTNASGDRVSPDEVDWSDAADVARNYRIRQNPGPGNALGSVKFMFPNRYSVYLHDTNAPGVFQRDNRAVSHGCIRVSEPKALADYLLAHNTAYSSRTFESFLGSSPRRVDLATPVPIHLVYITAWAEAHGDVRFFRDIYNQDTGLMSRMDENAHDFSTPWKEAAGPVTEARTALGEPLFALLSLREERP
ncbi:L,D-transpeptidase family protein [Phaeovibrio sulfidiphilus]|uniref:L,D-transpeptidase family protein n=1 Tax=Phaeovibrio sulfidiphilus TaxID=1220600 RepID=A0A8J6YYM7_9PROT|nr:L,D-transpeptidase family protein [Phaeovibrio sulfidiphilus]MBE1236938.1 L,D-transpeptidase family protein [Phaeovibrio sulfidiphilus]